MDRATDKEKWKRITWEVKNLHDKWLLKGKEKNISTWVEGLLYENVFDFINTKTQTFSAHKVGHSFVTISETGALSY
jgi:hypothetical protein